MTKEEFRQNLYEATNSIHSLEEDELDFAVEMLYDGETTWTFDDFYTFAQEVAAEWGDLKHVLNQYDALPDLTSEQNAQLLDDWFDDHPQAYRDACRYIKREGK